VAAAHGTTVHAWIHALRMRDAARLLHPSKQVKYIAILLGYTQVSHFSRHFKAHYGVPPSRFIIDPSSQLLSDLFEKQYCEILDSHRPQINVRCRD
jgi:AraC-like DNA-binding protein